MGSIPSIEDWTLQVDYQAKLQEIKNIKTVKLEQTDIDLAELHNKNIEDLKRERLKEEKTKKIKELNDKFGIESEPEEEKEIEGLPKNDKKRTKSRQEMLWEKLEGKGLLNKKDD